MTDVIFNGRRLKAVDIGEVFVTHPVSDCTGRRCCIHYPSEHPLWRAPLHWRSDRQIMERICTHGIGHPDPDDMDYRSSIEEFGLAEGVHGCDGCCRQESNND